MYKMVCWQNCRQGVSLLIHNERTVKVRWAILATCQCRSVQAAACFIIFAVFWCVTFCAINIYTFYITVLYFIIIAISSTVSCDHKSASGRKPKWERVRTGDKTPQHCTKSGSCDPFKNLCKFWLQLLLSFDGFIAPVVTATSIIVISNKIKNGDILVPIHQLS